MKPPKDKPCTNNHKKYSSQEKNIQLAYFTVPIVLTHSSEYLI